QDVGQGEFHAAVARAHDPVVGRGPAFVRYRPASMLPGVDYPDVRDAELEIVIDAVLHGRDRVFRGHHLDTEVRWGCEDFLFRERKFAHNDIGDANPGGTHT